MKGLKFVATVLPVFLVLLFCPQEVRAESDNTILDGVHIGPVDVSGMTQEEAYAAVDQKVADMMDDQITFHVQGTVFTTSAQSLGYTWLNTDVAEDAVVYGKSGNIVSKYKIRKDLENEAKVIPLETSVDSAVIGEVLEDNCTEGDKRVKNMSLSHENGVFTVVPGEEGRQLNIGASVSSISQFMTSSWMGGDADIDLIQEVQQPKGDEAQLAKVKDVLGKASTDYSSSKQNRRTNVENGTAKIAGSILYPGDSLSVLDEVLPFEESNGYAKAGSYLNGEVIDSIGGGVCQVSTTLYLAIIRAELQIDKRYSHSMTVKYVKPSMDAAVAEGSKDLIFTNNTDAPVFIEGWAGDGTVEFTIYGQESRSPGRTVTYESQVLENSDPTVQMEAMLWKVVNENGQETKTEFNHSTYYMGKSNED